MKTIEYKLPPKPLRIYDDSPLYHYYLCRMADDNHADQLIYYGTDMETAITDQRKLCRENPYSTYEIRPSLVSYDGSKPFGNWDEIYESLGLKKNG